MEYVGHGRHVVTFLILDAHVLVSLSINFANLQLSTETLCRVKQALAPNFLCPARKRIIASVPRERWSMCRCGNVFSWKLNCRVP